MSDVKANQVYGDVTVVSVRKANAREMRSMAHQFASARRSGYDSNDKVVLFQEEGSKLISTMTLGGFIRNYVK